MAHPIQVVVTDDLRRNRLTVFFRLILAIPHFIVFALWSIDDFDPSPHVTGNGTNEIVQTGPRKSRPATPKQAATARRFRSVATRRG